MREILFITSKVYFVLSTIKDNAETFEIFAWENIDEEKRAEASLIRVVSTRSNLTASSKRGGQRSVTRLHSHGEPTLSHNASPNLTIPILTRV